MEEGTAGEAVALEGIVFLSLSRFAAIPVAKVVKRMFSLRLGKFSLCLNTF